MELIGQQHILAALEKYTLRTLPKTLLFIGDAGSEKHLLAQKLAERFGLEVVEITNKVTDEDIISFQQDPNTKFYTILLNNFTEKQQNQFLKFIEEPSPNVYIILMARTTVGILPTILNRCIKFYCSEYTQEQLEKVASFAVRNPNDLVYKICKTPGQLMDVDGDIIAALYKRCVEIVTLISKANYANAIKVATEVNCKEEYDKYDYNQFFAMMEYVAFENFLKTKSDLSYKIYTLTNSYRQKMITLPLAKEALLLNYLTNLWEATR